MVPPCRALEWQHAHHAAALLAIRDGLAGFDTEALDRAERLLHADADVMAAQRTYVQALLGTVLATEAIELAAFLGAILGARDAAAMTREVLVRIDVVELALVSLAPEEWSIEQSILGEWIFTTRAIDSIASEPTFGFDRDGLYARFARFHEESIEYARDPRRAPPPRPIEPDPWWRWTAPTTLQTLQILDRDVTPLIDRFHTARTRCQDRIAVARVALAAARDRAESAVRAQADAPPR
jgi:hypothetical protein